jgi:hypothetical protein
MLPTRDLEAQWKKEDSERGPNAASFLLDRGHGAAQE